MNNTFRNRIFAVLIFIVAYASFCVTSIFAEDYSDVIVSLQINNPIMKVNGLEKEIDTGYGTKPIVIEERTLVPIRAIVEAFGGTVEWDSAERAVLLNMNNDTIKLIIDSSTAYLNNEAEVLDVVPQVINERTMLPIRFVAEGFNLGVAWDSETQTIYVIRDYFNQQEYDNLMGELQEYSGEPYLQINGNKPLFKDYEIITGSFEYYSNLDDFGRCNVCYSSITSDIMPIESRESISSVTPSGWVNNAYDIIEGKYLYNRCHLIGFQLTGENANKKNIITGTRYMNVEGMLPFENSVAEYIKTTGNRVMYRATPVFIKDNLVANGVLLEAYSVEDGGEGVSFCVYCYNIQPGITIDYKTGTNKLNDEKYTNLNETGAISGIYRTPSGKRYHYDYDCGGKNSYEITLEEAIEAGLTPCEKCVK